jgi:hypothetical protein
MNSLSAEITQVVDAAEPVLRAVGEKESEQPVLAGGWSRKQVLGHLIDSASNNHQRFVRAALEGSLEFPGYEQAGWARIQAAGEVPWLALVALWADYNRYLAHVIARLPADRLESRCRIGTSEPVTLKFLAHDYLRHLLHHLKQIGAAPASR